jgi:hypothetical protein
MADGSVSLFPEPVAEKKKPRRFPSGAFCRRRLIRMAYVRIDRRASGFTINIAASSRIGLPAQRKLP